MLIEVFSFSKSCVIYVSYKLVFLNFVLEMFLLVKIRDIFSRNHHCENLRSYAESRSMFFEQGENLSLVPIQNSG